MTNSADPDQLASTDLNLHCLLRQGMSCSAREGLSLQIYRLNIAPDKALFLQPKSTDIFLISPQKHMLWYALESPH